MCSISLYTPKKSHFLVIFLAITETMASEVMGQSCNNFGMDLFKAVSSDEGNLLISPLSAHIVLSMAYQGAGGETEANMAKILHFPAARTTAEEYHKVITSLNAVKEVILDVGNKIFVKTGFQLKPDFVKCMVEKYLSAADEIDFNDAARAANTINSWVEDKTNKRIKDLFEASNFDDLTRLVLVNAVYFKGKWVHPFKKEVTTKKPFYLVNGEEVSVDTMYISTKFNYKEDADLDCKILELPYVGGELSMIILLPNARDGIHQLQEKLVKSNFADVTKNMHHVTVNVDLPKFRIESTIQLTDILKQMGAGHMFSNNADFSNMANISLTVSEVIQKTFIEVNEEGAEAAAATGVVMMLRCMPMRLPTETFKADHPFLITLVDKKSMADNALLFCGRVYHPGV